MDASEQMVLVVDDDDLVRSVLCRQLTALGYEAMGANGGEAGLEILAVGRFSAALVDLHMPVMDGHATLAALLQRDPQLAVLMVTGAGDVDDAVRAMHAGAYDHLSKPISLDQLRLALERALELRRLRRSREDQERQTQAKLDEQQQRLERSALEMVTALAAALEAKDPYTCGHSERVTRYAVQLAWKVGLDSREIENLTLAGQLHDIGKIGIREEVLNKPGKLTDEEFDHIKSHPLTGVQILQKVDSLAAALPIVRHHHERYDGKGYPDGLAGEDIPLPARVVAVADAFDAMTSSRAYRSALPTAEARRRLLEGSGTQFDTELVEVFVGLLDSGELQMPEEAEPETPAAHPEPQAAACAAGDAA